MVTNQSEVKLINLSLIMLEQSYLLINKSMCSYTVCFFNFILNPGSVFGRFLFVWSYVP